MTILCERDQAVATEIAASLDGPVRVVPDLAAAALCAEADEGENLVVIGCDAPLGGSLQFSRVLIAQRPAAVVMLLRREVDPGAVSAAFEAGVFEVVPAGDPSALVDACHRALAARLAVGAVANVVQFGDEPRGSADAVASSPADLDVSSRSDATNAPFVDGGPRARVITVFSPKGGSGKTTIATNLAVALNRPGGRVCLIDLDLEFGDVAISLRLTPVRTLADAVLTELRGDADEEGAIQRLLTAYRDGFDCVLAPIEPGEADKVPADLVGSLIEQLRYRYDYVVIDTPSRFSEHVLAALDASDHHVLLTNPEIPALKNLRLTLDMLDLLGYEHERRSIVFNRADSAAGLSAAEVEEALKSSIAVHVPASRDVPASINRGVPIVAASPDHPVSRAVRRFAANTIAIEQTGSRRPPGRRSRFLGRRSR